MKRKNKIHIVKRKFTRAVFAALFMLCPLLQLQAQDKIINPSIVYEGMPRTCTIGGLNVKGIKGYEDFVLLGISGLEIGQEITLPGKEITEAVKRYWKNGLFSDVAISADSLIGDQVYLTVHLKQRPRISEIRYYGIKKSEREDMEEKLGMMKGSQITPNMKDRAKILAKKYFDDKGFKNAEITIEEIEDVANENQVFLDVTIDKKEKTKVKEIIFEGNDKITTKMMKGSLIKKGVLKKLHEAGKFSNIFSGKKFTDEKLKEDKENILKKYSELGYRDAEIVKDSVWNVDDKHVNVYFKIDEGQKYYVRNITWVGNTVLPTDGLNRTLRMKKGDVYNQVHMNKRLKDDEDAIGNYYYNTGYVFFRCDPTEINIVDDSVDIEMRIVEGPQAHINRVRITGNDRLYEHVVRRELRTKPGDLFSKDAIERSVRELASMGHFDPEQCVPDIKPDPDNGTVDIDWNLVSKGNDQIEFSLGWGQTGVIGRVSLKLNNFSMRNLFGKNKAHRGIMPIGDGEQMTISAQTNGSYYQSYSISYMDPWFGRKRPNMFSVGAFYSKQTDISSSYYNSSYYNNYYNYLSGYGSSYYSDYTDYYDPDKYIQMFGASLGWGKRLRWPDDYFQFSATLAYQRYMLKNWRYFLIQTGHCNNINLSLALTRTSTDNQLFPRRGSEFSLSVTLTPPFSAWDNKDYSGLAQNPLDAHYQDELQDKYRWIEYHKWKFKSRTFTALTSAQKCFVLMTRAEIGILGSYNQNKKSPFETFYVGGDGMSGYSTSYAEETVGLRGYENGSLTPQGYTGYAYDRFTLELRYPFLFGNTTIYGLGFVEGGNAWTETKSFNPFDMKRSAGLGVRIFLPMVGLMGIDWAYGFDKVYGSNSAGGSHFHFILGQEF